MSNQGAIGEEAGLSAPVALSASAPSDAGPGPALLKRLHNATSAPFPHVLTAEHLGATTVVLPRASARQRAAMLAFAVEDRIAAPLDATLVTLGPGAPGVDGAQLVFVVDRATLAACPDEAPRILPEILLIPRPAAGWAVWIENARALVRAADGTGFAVRAEMLALLWQRAGKPQITLLRGRLDEDLPHDDRTDVPPSPDPAELAYGLPRNRPQDSAQLWRPWRIAAGIAVAGLLAHLAILATDVTALRRIAEAERATAQAAVAGPLPGIAVTPDVGPLLARLTPTAQAPQGSDLLPLLSEVSNVLAQTAPAATFRRLAWGAAEGDLVVLVQAGGLDALQQIETALTARGLVVRPGAASATDAGAEAEIRIGRSGA